jgi:hypothetical protein
VKLAPLSAAVLRQNAGPLLPPLPTGVVPLDHRISNDQLEGAPPQGNLKKSKVTHIYCSDRNGYQWCYCPTDGTNPDGYACCLNQNCGFTNGMCGCQ